MNLNAIAHVSGYDFVESLYSSARTFVYRGVRRSDQRPVVIKIPRNKFPKIDDLISFRNQYVITRDLQHPTIVQPLALERFGNGYALIMPDDGSITLAAYWNQVCPDLKNFLTFAIQLSSALHFLSQQRIIHKDIKPSNILIQPETAQIRLIDFNFASLLPQEQQFTNSSNLDGTLAYVSPEQTGRMNRSIDYRTDFYSLGVSFFELLTGSLPFPNSDPMELIYCHIAKAAIFPSESKRFAVPAIVQAIVLKLMAKNAEDRYQSALGIRFDLENCLQQLEAHERIEPFKLGTEDVCDHFLLPEKLYGREEEVRTILDAFSRACAGHAEIILVAGYSGIGKTAVIKEVHKPITRQHGYFIQGKFDQFNRNIPFSAFVQAFRSLIGQLLAESDETLQSWKTNIQKALGENGKILLEVIPELTRVIGEQPGVSELSSSAEQNRYNLLFSKFVQVFTTSDHPLVIFLDDLQWADRASLNLLQLLMTSSASTNSAATHLLVVGAYRNNEVLSSHPLMLSLSEIDKQGASINTISLAPLHQPDINRLVADTLLCTIENAEPLARLVYQKTHGNPFFATQFLQTLYDEACIKYDSATGRWQCDLARAKQLALSDDVLKFMVERLTRLPPATRNALKFASCLGNQFDLATLAMVCVCPEEQIAADLWEALQAGLIVPESNAYKFFQGSNKNVENSQSVAVNFHFMHDRVQQASYRLISKTERLRTHHAIGRTLLNNTLAEAQDENIFEIVNQLNKSIGFIHRPEEISQLVQMNLRAAQKARHSTAYRAALDYSNTGIGLLEKDSWNKDYRTTLDLHHLAAEAAYLDGDFAKMRDLIEMTTSQAHNILDQVKVYETKIASCINQGNHWEAISEGRACLKELGIILPTNPKKIDILIKFSQTKLIQGKRSAKDFAHAPLMANPAHKAALVILELLTIPAMTVSPMINAYKLLISAQLTMRYGNSTMSSICYASYGFLLANIIRDIPAGKQFGELALWFLTQDKHEKNKAKVYMLYYGSNYYLTGAIHDTLPKLEEGYVAGLEAGNSESTEFLACAYCFNFFWSGKPLAELVSAVDRFATLLEKSTQKNGLAAIQCNQQTALNLINKDQEHWILNGPIFDAGYQLNIYQELGDNIGPFLMQTQQLLLAYLFDKFDEAIVFCRSIENNIEDIKGIAVIPSFHFLYSLCLIAIQNPTSKHSKLSTNKDNARIRLSLKILRKYAKHAPMNYQHKVDLIQAEQYRISGSSVKAVESYDRAIEGAKANEYFQEEAMANELAAKFFLGWEKPKIAAGYMQEAYYCYARWGATAKTSDLENRYPWLLDPVLSTSGPHAKTKDNYPEFAGIESSTSGSPRVSSSDNITLDFAAVLKASQALSGIFQLGALLQQLTQIILQNSGSDRCALMLPTPDGHWKVRAIASPESTELCSIPLEETHSLPIQLIQYVKNTREQVVIDDFHADGAPFSIQDTYLNRHQPQSALSLPVLNQGKLVGILYLQNQSVRRVFTDDRILVVEVLCTQAAVSLENARLYRELNDYSQTLEKKIDERTATLRESEHRYMSLATAAPVGIFRTDQSRILLYVNDHWRQITDSPTGLEQYDCLGPVHPEDSDRVISQWQHAAQNQCIFQLEYRLQNSQDSVSWVQAQAVAEKDAKELVIGYVGTLTDISDRKVAEQQLQNLIEGTAATGQDFFPALVKHISIALNVSFSIVSELSDGTLNTLGVWAEGKSQSPFSYDLRSTPCEQSLREDVFFCATAVQDMFPENQDLADLEADSYMGIALRDRDGDAIGSLCILDRSPIQNPQRAEQILRLFAVRASAELERQRTEVAMKRQLATIEAAVDGIGIMQGDTFLYVNQAHLDLFGYQNPNDLIGKSWHILYPPEEVKRFETELLPILKRSRAWQGEAVARHKNGSTFPEGLSLTLTEDGLLIRVCRDISELKNFQSQIVHNSLHDSLTQLPNRALLMERLDLIIHRSQRAESHHYAVLFLDLDRFKVINDSLGHTVGDQLLTAIAQRLTSHLRNTDLVARLGGDEFVILLEDINSPEYVVQLAERILENCKTPILIDGIEIFSNFSIGIVWGTKDYLQASDLIRDADIAMYQAKLTDSNSFKFFDATMHTDILNRLTVETDFRKALEQEQFKVYYQPIFNLVENKLIGFEALARWHHPTRGLLTPRDFISIAEETGLIVALDRWMFSNACEQLVDWRSRFRQCSTLKINVNLSAPGLQRPDLISDIDTVLSESRLGGNSIVLEITESMLIEDIDQTIDLLSQLDTRNIQISIDDFGTGYSSLSYLHKLPVNSIKIDQSFVGQMARADNRNSQVVSTIIALSDQLGLTAVAEGIETQRQLDQLQNLGCELGQGFLFSKPLTANEVEHFFLQST